MGPYSDGARVRVEAGGAGLEGHDVGQLVAAALEALQADAEAHVRLLKATRNFHQMIPNVHT